MAEPVGLAMGGIALVGLFETGMAAFEHIENAKEYGGEYQKLALKTAILRLRLDRWAQGVELASKIKEVGTAKDGETAKKLLGHIMTDIKATQELAQRYKIDENTTAATASDKKVDEVDALIARVNAMAIRRQKGTSIGKIVRWALHDQRRFNNLIGDLDQNISGLEKLFSPEARFEAQQVAKSEGEELIQASTVQQPGDDSATPMALLAEATEGVDDVLKKALQQAAPNDMRNIFSGNFVQSGEAKVLIGDRIAAGQSGANSTSGATYSGNFHASGKANVTYGREIGGEGGFNGRGVLDR